MNVTSAYEWTPNTLLAGFPGLLLTTYYQQQIISIPAGLPFCSTVCNSLVLCQVFYVTGLLNHRETSISLAVKMKVISVLSFVYVR